MAPIPKLDIPHSDKTVELSIVDTTTRAFGLPTSAFMMPTIKGFEVYSGGCSWAFLIKHGKDVLLYDMGARKDSENGPQVTLEQMKSIGAGFTVDKNVADILKEGGQDPAGVNAIIWSHYHNDHTGDPTTFPSSTSLIVGPGFKKTFVPAWPTVKDSPVDENAWANRELREIDFDAESNGLEIGGYKAIDFYGDGSLYLIHAPGHTAGHMSALARTSADPVEFVLIGGDVAHQCGEFRPTEFIPLPDSIEPNPLEKAFAKGVGACPGAIFEQVHPKHSRTEPFLEATGWIHEDQAQACESVKKLLPLDAQDNIFSMIAHDITLADVCEFFPATVNDWKKKGWKEQSFWRFLRDFDTSD